MAQARVFISYRREDAGDAARAPVCLINAISVTRKDFDRFIPVVNDVLESVRIGGER